MTASIWGRPCRHEPSKKTMSPSSANSAASARPSPRSHAASTRRSRLCSLDSTTSGLTSLLIIESAREPRGGDAEQSQGSRDPLRRGEVAPCQRRHLRHHEGQGAELQDGSGEICRRREQIGLSNGPRLVLSAEEEIHSAQAVVQEGHAVVTGLDESTHPRREHEHVPEATILKQGVRQLLRRLLLKAADPAQWTPGGPGHGLAGLDPTVLGLGLRGLSAEDEDRL